MAIQYQKRLGLTAEQQADGISVVTSSMKFKLSDTEFYEQVTQRNGKLKKSDVIAIFETARQVVLSYCNDGIGIRIPDFLDILPAVGGTQNVKGEWIKGPHKRLHVHMAKSLVATFRQEATLEPIPAVTIAPVIDAIEDPHSGTINTTLSVGRSVAIIGNYLKFHPLMGDEGVFFVKSDGMMVRATRYLDNKPQRLTFEVPDELKDEGSCTLEVRMRHERNKALRITVYSQVLNLV